MKKNWAWAVLLLLSVTVRVKLVNPVPDGVPEIEPFPGLRTRPPGNCPLVIA